MHLWACKLAHLQTDELKKLLKGSTAVLILENGEPSFVILGYNSYKNLLFGQEQEEEIKINHPERREVKSSNASDKNHLMERLRPVDSGDQKFQHKVSEKESEFLEKINKQILALKNEIEKEEQAAGNP